MLAGADTGLIGYPDVRLRRSCRPVDPGEPDLEALTARMREAMRRHRGVGLAAPQVGVALRLVVTDAPGYGKGRGRLTLLNPRVRHLSGDRSPFREGCLSFPGIYRDILRPRSAVIDYQDLRGERHRLEDEGLLLI